MGKKKKLRALKAMANNMPLINQITHEVHHYKGSEILEWGTIEEIDGVKIDPEKMYTFNYPVMLAGNNRRQMKRAFLRNGVAGVKAVLDHSANVIHANLNAQ